MNLEGKMTIDKTAIVEGTNQLEEGVLIGPYCSVKDIKIGRNTKLFRYINAYDCEIGADVKVGGFTEIQGGAKIGDRVILSSHSFICDLATIGNDVFIGHGVMTINDLYPPSQRRTGSSSHWQRTLIGNGVVIGSNSTLFPIVIGDRAVIGAGSVVRKDVPAGQVWAGNPAKYICDTKDLKYEDGTYVFPELT